jgi:peptidoglycan/xylan/chitin deacetylase (PgdA/CDA1 family)
MVILSSAEHGMAFPDKFELSAGSEISSIQAGIAGTILNAKAFGLGTTAGTDNTDVAFIKDSSITKNIKVVVDSTAGSTAHNVDYAISRQFFNTGPPLIGIWVYLVDQTKWTGFTLFLTPNVFTDYFQATAFSIQTPKQGWNFFAVHKDDFIVGGGAPNWSQTMTRMRMQVTGAAGQIATLYLDKNAAEFYGRPQAVFTFDGNWVDTYSTIYPIMNGHQWQGSIMVSGNSLGVVGFESIQNLITLQGLGWDMLSHSHTSPDFTSLNTAQTLAELTNGEMAMNNAGLRLTAKHLAWPSGNHNIASENNVKEAGYLSALDASGFTQTPTHTIKGIDGNAYRVERCTLNNSLSLSTAKAEVDQAIKYGATVVFLVHTLGTPAGALQWTVADFQALADYVAQREPSITVSRYSEWWDTYSGARRKR